MGDAGAVMSGGSNERSSLGSVACNHPCCCGLSLSSFRSADRPADRGKAADRHSYIIEPSSYAAALPAGLQSGDVVNAARMDTVSRLGLTTNSFVPAGTRITLVVNRQGRELQVPVTFVPIPATVYNVIGGVLGIALIWLVAALGLLILWCGRRLAAVGVGVWCLAQLCWEVPISFLYRCRLPAGRMWVAWRFSTPAP